MAITTLTLNGVQIETTASLAEIMSALPTNTPAQQPKAAEATTTQPAPEPKARPKATKRTTAPKEPTARQPKAARPKADKVNGKALWADITKAVQNGDYVTARRLAEPKPDTFGVQCEAAIERHMKRTAKPTAERSDQPKAQPKAEKRQSALPPKGEEATPKRITPKAEAERIDAKARAAAKAADEAADNERPEPKAPKARNHKPDCKCVACPEGVKARKAKAAAKAQPKADAAKAAAPEAKPRQAGKPAGKEDPAILAAAEQQEAERVLAKSLEQAEGLAKALDLTGLKEATRQCLILANRQERLGNVSLYEAYKDSADLFQDALNEAKANTLA